MTGTLPSSAAYGRWLAILRFFTGAMWLAHGVPKFTHSAEFMPAAGPLDCATALQTKTSFMSAFVCGGLQNSTGAYHQFLAATVIPNVSIFAELVRLGEVCAGLALLLGALTRLGGLTGMVLTANYIAARGHPWTSSTLQSLDFAMFVLSAVSLVLPTGRVWGVDGLWARGRRRPATPTVRAEFVPEPPLEGPTAPPSA
ncbi:MAG TPA: DoxX family membrane protein [Candidatus Acidoferrales bacterium]|nr:DoxX family membrane protein [Candidatus Acidoferrales bacterium]